MTADARTLAAEVARTSYGRLIALLAAPTRDIAAAEDALSDAFEQALARWPSTGVPANPEGWLLTVARNRQRDRYKSLAFRASVPLDDALETLPHDGAGGTDHDGGTGEWIGEWAGEWADDDVIPDKRLALMFVCAHPAIDPTVRAPLMLQTVLGFTTEQIARAFAIPAPTMAQRLVRAKRRIRDTGVPFVVPERSAMAARMSEVLEAIYATYAIDWHGIAGSQQRDSMAHEAIYLAETLAELTGGDPESLGLAALMCLSSARAQARRDADGRLVPLADQDATLWDAELIARGEAHLMRAHAQGRLGRFQLEAAIQSAHCARRSAGATNWIVVLRLYDGLIALAPTLGALVSRAAVIGELEGPDAGLAALDAIAEAAAQRFQPVWATRAHLLARAGNRTDAAAAYERAVSLTTDVAERNYLLSALAKLT